MLTQQLWLHSSTLSWKLSDIRLSEAERGEEDGEEFNNDVYEFIKATALVIVKK